MKRSKHTPGPWLVSIPRNPAPMCELDRLIHTVDGRHIAEVFQYQNHEHRFGPTRDDAQLIAASPNLLDAAKRVVKLLPRDLNSSAVIILEQAIDKAEGKHHRPL